ncbi:MAG: YqgE/AlgH family protein [Gammaproteobacteria bacterium]|nr:YqgE/AlgH family protein [Gammaproteobacteria bacterium]MDH3856422.1 YqgE/AlgH family protein [Gammaproteobacteria bacterium]
MSQQPASLVDKCLIATPAIKDPIFASSLIYMCEHNENGSMGLVVNHETSQVLDDIFQQLDISCEDDVIKNQPVFIGGPVQLEQGFVLHSSEGRWQNSIEVSSGINLTSSLDILQAIANGKGPQDYLVILGFSGWASGQLESELQQNSWLTSTCNPDLLFHEKPEDKWQVAFDTLGFDINMLSPVSGNA